MDDASSEAAYRDAFSLLRSGEYDRAVTAFNDFQASFPNSQYGDNAQYWLAEAHYAKRNFAAAVTEYQKMLVNYPASRKQSHAMLKLGYSYDSLGQPADARAILEDLKQRFPGSAAARLADERLLQLGAAAP
jgi:tol-pal system protein YbgF